MDVGFTDLTRGSWIFRIRVSLLGQGPGPQNVILRVCFTNASLRKTRDETSKRQLCFLILNTCRYGALLVSSGRIQTFDPDVRLVGAAHAPSTLVVKGGLTEIVTKSEANFMGVDVFNSRVAGIDSIACDDSC